MRDIDTLQPVGVLSDERTDDTRKLMRLELSSKLYADLAALLKTPGAICSRHTRLMRRANQGKQPPWWTLPRRRLSFRQLLFANESATVQNLLSLLRTGQITEDDLEAFRRSVRSAEVVARIDTVLRKHYGDDPATSLRGALTHPEEWCRPTVAFRITSAVESDEFEEYFLTGMVGDQLLAQLVEARLINSAFVASLHRRAEAVLDADCTPSPISGFNTGELQTLLDEESAPSR